MLEHVLGTYSSQLLSDWRLPDEFDAAGAALRFVDHPNVWTDGSLVLDKVSVPLLLVLGSMLIFLARVGDLVGGDTLMTSVLMMALLNPVEASALYQVLYRLCREQSSGGSFCPAGVHGCSPREWIS